MNKHLVFIGGGHSHALVIKQLGLKPIPGVHITLISEQQLTPYSGMLPGFVAGHYSFLDAHIDLKHLCKWASVRFICGTVSGIDANANTVFVDSHDPVHYDLLSIDIGSTPDLSVPGAREYATGVKPVSQFGALWHQLLKDSEDSVEGDWGIVGAGAGGVELVLGMAHKLKAQKQLNFHLVFPSARVLPGYPTNVVKAAEKALERYNITLHPNFRVAEVQNSGLQSVDSTNIVLDKSIWCTGAAAAGWLKDTGLAVSEKGFVSVNAFLQSESHANVFAAGDCADMQSDPRSKAGVYAVRQAPFLENNLRAISVDENLKSVKLQTDFLSILSLGEKKAVATRNGITLSGGFVWKLKDRIDQNFMRSLKEL